MKRISIFCVCFAICMALFAQATDLTIDNQTPGWLSSKISQADRLTVENLKVIGYVNGNDLKFIGGLMQNRSLHGCVDLSEVYVVGEKDNYMGNGSFNSEGTVKRLILPKTLEELEQCLATSDGYYTFKSLQVDTLVFEPENIHFVEGSFFSLRYLTPHTSLDYHRIGVPANLIIGGAVDSIPENAFYFASSNSNENYEKLLSVTFNGKIRYVGSNAFSQTGLRMTRALAEKLLDEADYIAPGAFTCSIDSLHVPARWETYNLHTFTINSGGHVFFEKNLKTLTKISKDYISDVHLHFKTMGPPNIADRLTWGGPIYIYVPKGARAAYEAKAEQFSSNLTIIEETPVESISINSHELQMERESTIRLSVTILPTDADDKTLKWNSQDETIAIVDEKGNVTGVSPGTTKIYATSVATGLQDECELTVIQHATDIQMETTEVTMTKLGETAQLNVTVLPENTTDKTVKWSSSNPSICTVTASGKIVAMGYGDAVIMAITNDGEIPATCIVKVARPKYKFTYMVDGAEYKSYEVELNSPITPEAEPTKEGYTFSGWSEVPATMPAKDVTVNGSFVINKYKLTYIVDGETYKTDEIEYGKSVIPEAEPEKEGYSFSGWSMIPETMPAKDVTVTGSFTKGEYQLIYIVDGQVYKTIHMNYGDAVLVEDAPQKEGYTFSGWSEIPGTMPAKDIAVMGSFTVNSYKLTYTVDGEEYKSVQVNYGAAIIPEAEPTKEGYSFSGWGDIPATMPSCDVAVAGSFTVNSYKLIYMVDGEEYKIVDVAYGTSITAEAEPTKEGYSFSGWGEIPATMPANDVTVTGSFTINKYTLVYVVDGENYVTYEVNYGTQIFPLPDLTKDGYTFSGWSDIPATMPAHDVTITGTFTFVDAIEGVLADDGEYQIYTLDGMPIETLQKGVNIIKYISGKVKKVVVK